LLAGCGEESRYFGNALPPKGSDWFTRLSVLEAIRMNPVDRRTFLGLGALPLPACALESPYFGNTQPPARQELVCTVTAGAVMLDPALGGGPSGESQILRAIFEGLTNLHPGTVEPTAGIATHYTVSPDGIRFNLFLRGHPEPRGIALPGMRAHGEAARWSDGLPVTAHDFVYAWRRVAAPENAAMSAYLLHCIQHAKGITSGKLPSAKLGVRAVDDFRLQVDLESPAPFFLQLLSCTTLFPAPSRAVEQARRRRQETSWTEPKHIVTNGAFTLVEHRSRDRIVVKKSAQYYDASAVALEKVSFLLTPEASAGANLYKSGCAHVMPGLTFPPVLAPVLSRKRDLCSAPAFGTYFPCFNTRKPPFDNVLVRYAFNMALNKQSFTRVLGFGRQAALNLVPPVPGYSAPTSVFVQVNGTHYNVLGYDPLAARALLAAAGFTGGRDSRGNPLTFDFLYPSFEDTRLKAEILQSQWQAELGVRVKVTVQEFDTFLQNQYSLNYTGVTDSADWGYYRDPIWFLSEFTTGASANVAGWSDPRYDSMLAKATDTLDSAMRMERLAECERYLLRAMPFVPVYHDVWAYPQKPYVRGIIPNAMDVHPLKYAWIDTNWRPS
jgi:ABC-type oligopeptide transport system substrate-binding subunit